MVIDEREASCIKVALNVARRDLRSRLETSKILANDGYNNDGVSEYWRGFSSGVNVALEVLATIESEIDQINASKERNTRDDYEDALYSKTWYGL